MSLTPGPWKLSANRLNVYGDVKRQTLRSGWCESASVVCSVEESEEDARLIAAAPEMLEALQHIRDVFWSDGEPFEERLQYIQEYAAAAITKAEGRP